MSIQHLKPEHAATLAILHADSMERSWDEKSFSNFLNEKTITGLGFFDSEMLLGFVLYRTVIDETEILTIAVDGNYRRQGVASSLLKETMKANGVVFLEVNEDNKIAEALYLKAGFKIYGKRQDYYQTADGLKAAILMRRNAK